ncbi:MAG: T9SS type A sorting domain-containing protein [Bacteroidota bacterium]|nr:T9SS type A sorting domain-containing protein [Bacteroidota bacterium]
MSTKYSFKNIQRAVIFQLLCVIVVINNAISQNSQVVWSSFNMGYANSTQSNTMVKSVVGQNFVGTSQQSNTQVISGFLADTLFRSISVGVKEQKELPTEYSLSQNYPNPFNPTTTIRYDLPTASHVVLKVYNVLGQEVATLINEQKTVGKHSFEFRASDFELSSGVYFYRLVAGEFVSVKKFILVR